jgi:hypothetical protein
MNSTKGKTMILRINLMTCYLIGLLYKDKTILELYKNFFYFLGVFGVGAGLTCVCPYFLRLL